MKVNETATNVAETGSVAALVVNGVTISPETLQCLASLLAGNPFDLMQQFYEVHTYILRDMAAGRDGYHEHLDDLLQQFANIIITHKKTMKDEN